MEWHDGGDDDTRPSRDVRVLRHHRLWHCQSLALPATNEDHRNQQSPTTATPEFPRDPPPQTYYSDRQEETCPVSSPPHLASHTHPHTHTINTFEDIE